MSHLSVSVIVTTYNWPQALERVLNSLCAQQFKHMEVIVADDGSTDATADVIRMVRKKCDFPLLHCWQPDEGFRAAMIRNRAVAWARHDYLIFLDGDCIVPPHFVSNHAKLARKGWFVAGTRILLSEQFTHQVLSQILCIERWSWWQCIAASFSQKCNQIAPLKGIPLGRLRTWFPRKWEGVKTCNLGIWRQDFLAVNGLDEEYVGWGFEDSDLIIRLLRNGVCRKSGKYAVEVLHLWHANQDRASIGQNAQRLESTMQNTQVKAIAGIEQYLNHDDRQYS